MSDWPTEPKQPRNPWYHCYNCHINLHDRAIPSPYPNLEMTLCPECHNGEMRHNPHLDNCPQCPQEP